MAFFPTVGFLLLFSCCCFPVVVFLLLFSCCCFPVVIFPVVIFCCFSVVVFLYLFPVFDLIVRVRSSLGVLHRGGYFLESGGWLGRVGGLFFLLFYYFCFDLSDEEFFGSFA